MHQITTNKKHHLETLTHLITNMKEELAKLIKECEEIAGNWNGDEPGYAEEQAGIANEIIEKSNELIALINELNGTE